jgi:multidrug resistance efflux pump
VQVGAPVAGLLESWFVELNQEVYEGQLLGRIRSGQMDAAAQQSQLDLEKAQLRVTTLEADLISARLEVSRATADQTRARSELDRLEKIYERQKLLNKEGATPRLTFEKAEQDYQAAKAEFDARDVTAKQAAERVTSLTRELDAAKKAIGEKTEALENSKANLTSGDLHAPADGVIVGRRLQPGEPVDPSMKDLVQIATELTHMQATVEPPPQAMARIKVGLTATVRLPELTTEEFPGSVREIRGTQVIVDFTSPAPIVRPGLTAQVRIKL